MKKRKLLNSLQSRILFTMAVALTIICAIILGYNTYIYRIIEQQMNQTIQSMLDAYTKDISLSLHNTETFLLQNCLKEDTIQRIHKPHHETDYYLALREMQELFSASIDSYNLMDGLFLYDSQNATFVGKTKLTDNRNHNQMINRSMDSLICHFEESARERKNEWFSSLIDGEYQILRSSNYSSSFSLIALQNLENFWKNTKEGGAVTAAAAVLIVILCTAFTILQKRVFSQPIDRLVDAMNQLKNGNLQVRLQNENVLDEFRIVNETFDNMTQNIEKLKIHVHEEKMNKQHAELLYLQEQIKPHFLINCMNLIRTLSLIGDNEKVQKVTVLVSHYMRYSLTGSTKMELKHELAHVVNYEKLQKMRYGNEFALSIEVPETLMACKIPTMLIQVFVENAIKHELDPDRFLLIRVQIWDDEEKWLQLFICDNGDGFEEEILQCLNRHEKLLNSEGEHIGIYNVCQRLLLLYGEQAQIHFSNSNHGGAQIHIRIPIER